MNTFTATLPDGRTVTKRSTKTLTHVVVGINTAPDARWYKNWRDLTWEESEARARKVAGNKLRNSFHDFTSTEVITCTMVEKTPDIFKPHTCQLCGRRIEDNKGTIWQHGYEIEYHAEQGTCRGSHHLCYEKDCSLLPPEISMVRSQVLSKEAYLADLIANPPAVLEERLIIKKGMDVKIVPHERPEGFTPDGVNYASMYTSYASQFKHRVWDTEGQLQTYLRPRLTWLVKRLADWVPPVKEETNDPTTHA